MGLNVVSETAKRWIMSSGKALFFIALGLFGVFTVEFSVIGLLPSIVDRYGVSVAQAGGLIGIFAAVAAAGGPFMVLWLARFNRNLVLIGTLLIFTSVSIISAWAPNFLSLMGLRALSGLLLPVFFSLAFATAVALYPPQRAAHATSMAMMGESIGLVFGVPIIILIESHLSYEASFLFCALVCLIAAAGITQLPGTKKNSGEKHSAASLYILKKPVLWLGLLATVAVLSAMFAVYSYASEYLNNVGMNGNMISMLMVIFGLGGLAGNFFAGRYLAQNLKMTILAWPLVLGAAYFLLQTSAGHSFTLMALLCSIWGAAHTSGLVVSQFWIASSAEEAPEFATSLFVSAANIGVTLGATVGGTFISAMGVNGIFVAGWIFALAALILFALSARSRARPSLTN